MQFVAKAKYIRFSPYKLRPLVDVMRGKSARYALDWISTYPVKRSKPIRKLLESAIANARSAQNMEPQQLVVKDIRVDQGPIRRYFRPGAMGRSTILRKRQSHISVILAVAEDKESTVKKDNKA